MTVDIAIVLGSLIAIFIAAFSGLSYQINQVSKKVDNLANRLTEHEILCAKRHNSKTGEGWADGR